MKSTLCAIGVFYLLSLKAPFFGWHLRAAPLLFLHAHSTYSILQHRALYREYDLDRTLPLPEGQGDQEFAPSLVWGAECFQWRR